VGCLNDIIIVVYINRLRKRATATVGGTDDMQSETGATLLLQVKLRAALRIAQW
jgi:hypothetical protein